MSQTIFLKDSVHFISKDGKEYEVSNPEVVGGFYNHDENFILIELRTVEGWRFIGPDGQIEWPGNVNIVHQIKDSTGWVTTHELMYSKFPDERRRIVARLLPKEKTEREILDAAYHRNESTTIDDKGAMSFTESDYQQFDGKNLHIVTPESSETQEKMSHWQYQQFAEAAITQLKEKNEILESDNKLLREEIERLKASQLTEFTEDELKNLFAGYNHFFYTPNEYFSDKGKQIKHDVRKKIEYISKTVLFPDLNV